MNLLKYNYSKKVHLMCLVGHRPSQVDWSPKPQHPRPGKLVKCLSGERLGKPPSILNTSSEAAELLQWKTAAQLRSDHFIIVLLLLLL